MKIYFAGNGGIPEHRISELGVVNRLDSYHYLKSSMKRAKQMNKMYYLFLDSGAFSSLTKGVEINMDSYIRFIHELNPPIYAALDKIGDARKTKENVEYMESNGLSPIPTFHMGSDRSYLNKMLDKHPYIALGGMVGAGSSKGLRNWLDRVWKYIVDSGVKIKVHGFGMSNQSMMGFYPWESVDSTSWLAPVIFGRPVNGKTYDEIVLEYSKTKGNDCIIGLKGREREVILDKSIRHFLNLEKFINEKHNRGTFDRLSQQYLF